MSKPPTLHDELIEAGAKADEAKILARLAAQLGKLPAPQPFLPVLHSGWSWPRVAGLTAGAAAAFLIIGGGVMAMAETSHPGTALYPLKRASEIMMVDISPGYANSVMMQRADEIDSLTSQHGSEDMVLNQVSDYEQIVPRVHLDAATRDYCMDHLAHAARLTTGSEHRAIQEAIQQLYREN